MDRVFSSALDEFKCFETILRLFEIDRHSHDRVLKVCVHDYAGGLKQLVDDLYDIYPG